MQRPSLMKSTFARLNVVAMLLLIVTLVLASQPVVRADSPGTPASTSPTDAATAASATLSATSASTMSAAGQVELQFIGHSCTLIVAPDGTRIVSDPYADHPLGLPRFPGNISADVVTISHTHPDHANISAIQGKPKVLMSARTYQAGLVNITGYKGDHGKPLSMDNFVFVFEIGDVKIVHMGAAGVVTQADILAAMKDADVVVIDIAGDAEHPLKEEIDQLLSLNVRTIIPGHYSFEGKPAYYGSVTLDAFLKTLPPGLAVVRQGSSKIQVTPNMPQQVVVLTPAVTET
jgi:L-ascorbate metabolism protein UlaG (beta-lactamase superfamily)